MIATKLFLLPAFIHVAMIFVLVVKLGRGRVEAARRGKVQLRDIALDSSKWPGEIRKIGNAYGNQFELPVLYYAALALLLATGLVDWVAVGLSWAFVAARIVHVAIDPGANVVIRRFQAFVAGVLVLALLWLWFALRLFVTG